MKIKKLNDPNMHTLTQEQWEQRFAAVQEQEDVILSKTMTMVLINEIIFLYNEVNFPTVELCHCFRTNQGKPKECYLKLKSEGWK
jgi:hypothetical protein